MRTLLIATTNQGKVDELTRLLKDLPFQVISLQDVGRKIPPVQETADTFRGNAILKAQSYAKITGHVTLADDSGLVVDALQGRPGVYSSRFGSTDNSRNQKLLTLLKNTPPKERTARFVSVVAIYDPKSNRTYTAKGQVEGLITAKPVGAQGFGYDPVFYSLQLKKTFAQAGTQEKNRVSHRGLALKKARGILSRLG